MCKRKRYVMLTMEINEESLREILFKRAHTLPRWLYELVNHVTFKLIEDKEMQSIGGANENIACIGDTCYITQTFLKYPEPMKRVFFYIDYLTMFHYLGREHDMSDIDKCLAMEINLRFLSALEFLKRDIEEITKRYTHCMNTNITYYTTKPKPSGSRRQIQLTNDQLFMLPEEKRVCFEPDYYFSAAPKPTNEKEKEIMKLVIAKPKSFLGNVQILLDTDDVCVFEITPNTLSTKGGNLICMPYGKTNLRYYHTKTHTFLDSNSPLYQKFKEENDIVLSLLNIGTL